jgi:hypothetical protein
MFGSYKVRIDDELLDKLKQCAEAGGYESVDDFVVRVLYKEFNKIIPSGEGDSPSRELVRKRLQGLGYIE